MIVVITLGLVLLLGLVILALFVKAFLVILVVVVLVAIIILVVPPSHLTGPVCGALILHCLALTKPLAQVSLTLVLVLVLTLVVGLVVSGSGGIVPSALPTSVLPSVSHQLPTLTGGMVTGPQVFPSMLLSTQAEASSAGLGSLNQPAPIPRADSELLLGGHISQSMKEKIWNSAYIDMSILFIESPSSVLAKAHSGSEVTLMVEGDKMFLRPNASPTGRQSKLDTWDKWVSAFHTFMAIYIVKFPWRATELLKYAEVIRMAAVQFPGTGWRSYDEQFRLRQEIYPSRSWAALDVELWLTVAASAVTNNVSLNAGKPQVVGLRHSGKVCYAFNSAGGCKFFGCKYMHQCSKYSRSGHGAHACRSMGSAGQRSRTAFTKSVGNPKAMQGSIPALPASQAKADGSHGAASNSKGSFRSSYSN